MGLSNPPRHGEGDRPKDGGGGGPRTERMWHAPSTMLRMVPLPVPGRNGDSEHHAAHPCLSIQAAQAPFAKSRTRPI